MMVVCNQASRIFFAKVLICTFWPCALLRQTVVSDYFFCSDNVILSNLGEEYIAIVIVE